MPAPSLRTLVASLFLAACGYGIPDPKGPVPPGQDREVYGALEYFASRNMNCPQEQLVYESFSNQRHLFKGCSRDMEMIMLTGADAQALGYAKGFVLPSPANVYAKERKCDVRTTSLERVDHRTAIVDGCGARTTYLMACGTGGCTWIANVESRPN